MRIAVRSLKRSLLIAGIAAGLLAVAIPALADYLGPDRSVSTWTTERLVCDYQAVYDPPGSGYYGCGLTLYEPPDGTCESNVDAYFTSSSCGWPAGINCNTVNCDISRSSSVDSCNDGDPGCREVEHVVNQPPATVSGSISCGVPGSGGWCRGDGELSLSGSEPLSGYTILALEGTRNGEPFACSGAACGVPLLEGANDFDFWAISSWGDTSLMGSAGGLLDSQDPSLSGSASGTPGDNGWYVSNVTVEASASDASPGSGLAGLDVQIDGGGWAGYSGPFTIGEGSHNVELRAVDGAGNSETQSLDIDIDTQSPIADLDASPSFCPGCGESLDITVVVQDSGSGIAAWSLVASGRTVASGGGAFGQTITWDGGGLGAGTHTLELEARDEAGNASGASFDFGLIAPTPGPQDDSDDTGAGSSTFGSPTPVSSPTPTRTPSATSTASTVNFGPSTSLGAGLPAAPADDSIANLQSPISNGPSGSSPAVLPPSGVVFGGAALAIAGVATAIALETTRRRREEEARVREEMERKNAEAEAREAAQRATLAQARSEAEFNLILGQIWDQATGGRGPSNAWMLGAAAAVEAARRGPRRIEDEPPPPLPEWKEAMLEPKVPPPTPPPPPPIDLAKWTQADYAAREARPEGQVPAELDRDQVIVGPIIKAADEHFVRSDEIMLRGGIGTSISYGQVAEQSYTGHSYGGSALPALRGIGLLKDILVWTRDNTRLLEWMRDRGWIHADASAAVFYEDKEFLPVLSPDPVAYPDRGAPYEPFPRTVLAPGGQGLSITGVQLSNQSHEVLSIRSIRADLYTATADRPYRLIIGYPFDHPIIASPSYNLIQPGDMFRLSVDPIDIRPGTRAELHIGIRSESGRYGEIVQQIVP